MAKLTISLFSADCEGHKGIRAIKIRVGFRFPGAIWLPEASYSTKACCVGSTKGLKHASEWIWVWDGVEIGGLLAWIYSDDSGPGPNTITTELSLSPSLLVYPTRYLFLGPILEYTRTLAEKEGDNGAPSSETMTTRWDLGIKAGVLVNWSDERFCPLPYLGFSAGLSAVSLDIDEADILAEDSRLADNGHFYAFFLGGKLRLSDSFYMHFQPTLTFVSIGEREVTDIKIGTGFSGTF